MACCSSAACASAAFRFSFRCWPRTLGTGGVLEVCRELGIELIAYSPLALGLLSGRWSLDGPLPSGPRGALFRRLLPALKPLQALMAELAACHQISQTALALSWCRSHGAMPIPGLRRVGQVERCVRLWLLAAR